MVDYPVELTVVFDGGTGVTRCASREGMCFHTDVQLVVGQRLSGTLSATADGDSPGTTLGYSARVTDVRRDAGTGPFEVEARFDRLGFEPPRSPVRPQRLRRTPRHA